jgi:hypothetical protein
MVFRASDGFLKMLLKTPHQFCLQSSKIIAPVIGGLFCKEKQTQVF